jgi:hypothetical protein
MVTAGPSVTSMSLLAYDKFAEFIGVNGLAEHIPHVPGGKY